MLVLQSGGSGITSVVFGTGAKPLVRLGPRKGDGAEQAMLELVGSELVNRAAERAKRKEERERAAREGREPGEEE